MERSIGCGGVVVAGVGGAGVNAVHRLSAHVAAHTRLVAIDTSAQALGRAAAARILLDDGTGGMGTGGDVAAGRRAASAGRDAMQGAWDGADFVLVVAGLAGGTGGGAGPEVARLARQSGAVVIGFGVEPFPFEGRKVRQQAAMSRRELADACDAYVGLDTPRAASLVGASLPLDGALRVADDVLRQAVEALEALVDAEGWIEVGLAALRHGLARGGACCLAVGVGRGAEPAESAMRAALASPLADMTLLARSRSVLVHVAGPDELSVQDVEGAMGLIRRRLPASCRISVGCGRALLLGDTARVTLLAVTGRPMLAEAPPAASAARRDARADLRLPSLDALRLGVPVRQAV